MTKEWELRGCVSILESDVPTVPKTESGMRTDNPDVASHKKPKKAVMALELAKTARTR